MPDTSLRPKQRPRQTRGAAASQAPGRPATAAVLLLPIGVALAASWPNLQRSIAAAKVSQCVDSAVAETGLPPFPATLAECVRPSLPSFVESPLEPQLMNWLLDAANAPQSPQPALQQRLHGILATATIALGLPGGLLIALFLAVLGLSVFFSRRVHRQDPAHAPPLKPAAPTGSSVLIIDDDPLFARTAGRVLELRGFAVDCASGMDEAKGFLERHRYDCVFCDFRLKRMNGIETCEKLFEPEERKRCVIVSGAEPEEVFPTESRAFEFLHKPCSSGEIVELAQRISEGNHSPATLTHQAA